jgi:hypothetical protein
MILHNVLSKHLNRTQPVVCQAIAFPKVRIGIGGGKSACFQQVTLEESFFIHIFTHSRSRIQTLFCTSGTAFLHPS